MLKTREAGNDRVAMNALLLGRPITVPSSVIQYIGRTGQLMTPSRLKHPITGNSAARFAANAVSDSLKFLRLLLMLFLFGHEV